MLPFRDFKVEGKFASLAERAGDPPARVISLVPSTTESLFVLGLGQKVVGITDYCTFPEKQVAGLPRVGGTKNPRVREILALQPDLVIANREENTPEVVRALEGAGIEVLVQFPKTVVAAVESMYEMAALFRNQNAMLAVETLARSLDYAGAAGGTGQPTNYFCPIWFNEGESGPSWWMTFNRDTFPHDLLSMMGGKNIFAARDRRYPLKADLGDSPPDDPGERDTRYPRVLREEILAGKPELILLPSEPYSFDDEALSRVKSWFANTPAVRQDRVHLIDGSLVTWHGVRIAKALQDLPQYFS